MSKRTRRLSAAVLAALITMTLAGTAVSAEDSSVNAAAPSPAPVLQATAVTASSAAEESTASSSPAGKDSTASSLSADQEQKPASAGKDDTAAPAETDGKKMPASAEEKAETAVSGAADSAETAVSGKDGETAAASGSSASGGEVSSSAASEETADTIRGIVAIDPGHQAPSVDMSAQEPNGPGSAEMKTKASAGTTGSFTGIGEYELNMDISLLLRKELEKRGYEVVLTRENNETAISNSERAMLANESGADIYVRIHANGSDDPSVSGALTVSPGSDNPYVSHLAEKSAELSADILNSYCEATGLTNLGLTYSNAMTGINWSEIPVTILEMGYMTNEQDDMRMADAEFRGIMVTGIADGIDKWFADNPSPAAGSPRKTRGGRPVGEEGTKSDHAGQAGQDFKITAEMDKLAEKITADYIAPAEAAGEVWGVSVVDLTDRQRCTIGGDRRIRSASVLKLFIMAATYEQIYSSVPEAERDTAKADEGSYAGLLQAMITVSDNTAANSLVEALGGGDFEAGRLRLNEWCTEHGYTGTSMGRRFLASSFTEDNYTTSDDCALLLASIYDGTCVSAAASEQMQNLLKGQTRLNKIPAGVTAYNAVTANKTGELADPALGNVENDAAIIWGAQKDYVLCTLSENLAGNGEAITRIVSISDLVYRELNGQAG